MMKILYSFILVLFFANIIFAQSPQGQHPFTNNEQTLFTQSHRGNGMSFTQNQGQIVDVSGRPRPDILFKGDGGGVDVYLRKTGISYLQSNEGEVIHEIEESVEEKEKTGYVTIQEAKKLKQELERKAIVKLYRIDVDFVNANLNAETNTDDQVEGVTNFYYTHCPQGITQVKSFNEVTAKNVYENIDVKYYGGKMHGLKYDIIVNPGGDPSQIKLKYSGARELKIVNEKLIIETSFGQLGEYMPKVYQNINGKPVDVKAQYILNETTVNFELKSWNPDYPLIIDPWVSYYGGALSEAVLSVATDFSGNVVFTGATSSLNFPVTPGSFQTVLISSYSGFVVKMNSTGVRVWATYYDKFTGYGIACDAFGSIYVAGRGLNTTPIGSTAGNVVHQSTISNTAPVSFLIKFEPLFGTRLWATYYGLGSPSVVGSTPKMDYGQDVVTDGNNVYLYGTTASSINISTPGTFQTAINGTGEDVYVAKFASNGTRIWGTYVGGSGDERTGGIAYNALTGSIYIGGYTNSTNFPTTIYQTGYGGGNYDAFLFKLSPAGTQVWSTYYGGSGTDCGYVIVTDGLGNVIIGGVTGSTSMIASPGAYETTYDGGNGISSEGDCFLVKFNSSGVRQWGTYFGGDLWEIIGGLDVDALNNIYIYGEFEDTDAGNYPISTCAYQPLYGGGDTLFSGNKTYLAGEDAFIARYDSNGKQLCITYLGGPKEDEATIDQEYSTGPIKGGVLAVYGNNLHVVGETKGSFPVTSGAFQPIYGGGNGNGGDGYIAQLCINICEGLLGLNFAATLNSLCTNTPVTFTPAVYNTCDTSGYKYQWTFTGGNPASSTALNPTVNYPVAGNYPVKLVVTTACKKDSLTELIVVNSTCIITAKTLGSTICPNNCTDITATGANGTAPYSYSWNTGATTQTINVCPATSTNYLVTITDTFGNTASAPAAIVVQSQPLITTPTSTNVTCTKMGSATITVNSGTGPYAYSWSNGSTAFITNPARSSALNLAAGNYTVTVTDGNGCTKTVTYNITSTSPVSATFTSPTVACVGSLTNFINTGTPPGSGITYAWSIYDLSSPLINGPPFVSGTTTNFSYTFLTAGTYKIRHYVGNGTCYNNAESIIKVINCNGPAVTAIGNSVCPGLCATVNSSVIGGTSPYIYSWSNGSTTQNISPCPGSTTTYTVKITDNAGITATSTAVVAVNPAVSVTTTPINITCNGGTNGSATATGGGGSPAYSYSWSTGGTTSNILNLTSQIYTVTVIDSKGCTSTSTTAITSPPPLIGQFTKGIANCAGCGCKEWLMINAAGGSSPYSYTWPDGYVNRYKNHLCPGVYTINIMDKNGCSVNVNLTAP